jgi:hypothetical protein
VGIRLVIYVVLLATSAALAWHWWHEAHLPMTAERYALLCDNRPECYPEWGYFIGAVLAGLLTICLVLGGAVLGLRGLLFGSRRRS